MSALPQDATGFTIRPFAAADLTPAADLWVASWALTMPDIDFEARRPWFLQHVETLTAGGTRILVAQEIATGILAGFVMIEPVSRYLDQLAVAPAYWGRGAAEALMAAARSASPAGIVLDVNQDNPRAVAFYRRAGLEITSAGANPMSGRTTWRMEWTPGADGAEG